MPVARRRRIALLSVACGLTVSASAELRSDDVLDDRLDVGSFTIFENDQRTGREQFSVQRVTATDGVAIEVRAESAIGDRRAAVRLEVDSAGTPVRYSIEQRTGATVALRLGGQRIRGRFTTLSRSTIGESAREYLLVPHAIVLEDEGIIQYALLVRGRLMVAGDSIMIPVLTPIANRQSTVRLVLESTADTLSIAGARRATHRWRVTTSNDEIRRIWSDDEDRIFRVHIPARGFVAMRDDVPR